jgi:hypothetical protein
LRFADGLFRKSRFFVFGDAIIPRQHIIAEGWNIHGRDGRWMRESEALMAESRRVILGGVAALAPSIRAALDAVRERIRLDCFGIDGCMAEDGRLVIFEVNATMNFFPGSGFRPESPQAQTLGPATAALERVIRAKLESARAAGPTEGVASATAA